MSYRIPAILKVLGDNTAVVYSSGFIAPMAIALVRQLDEIHIQDLYALYQSAGWLSDGRRPTGEHRSIAQLRQMLANTDIVLALVDEDHDRLIGGVRILTDFVQNAWLLDLIIAESQRGLGLGRYLMDTAMALPDLRQVHTLRLHAPPQYIDFFAKWDFVPEETTDQVTLVRYRQNQNS